MLGHDGVVELLLATEKVDTDSKDRTSRTPLSCAAAHGHKGIVKLLLVIEKVDADSKDERGRTPLSWAAVIGHKAVVRLLLEKGTELETKSNSGLTPLS
jgi:ankyrin repeat protein